jgi:hypothetical protein
MKLIMENWRKYVVEEGPESKENLGVYANSN